MSGILKKIMDVSHWNDQPDCNYLQNTDYLGWQHNRNVKNIKNDSIKCQQKKNFFDQFQSIRINKKAFHNVISLLFQFNDFQGFADHIIEHT